MPKTPPKTHIAAAPRPWLTRRAGECAFPVGGESWRTLSCCNSCADGPYCQAHKALMRGPPAPDAEDLERALAPWIG